MDRSYEKKCPKIPGLYTGENITQPLADHFDRPTPAGPEILCNQRIGIGFQSGDEKTIVAVDPVEQLEREVSKVQQQKLEPNPRADLQLFDLMFSTGSDGHGMRVGTGGAHDDMQLGCGFGMIGAHTGKFWSQEFVKAQNSGIRDHQVAEVRKRSGKRRSLSDHCLKQMLDDHFEKPDQSRSEALVKGRRRYRHSGSQFILASQTGNATGFSGGESKRQYPEKNCRVQLAFSQNKTCCACEVPRFFCRKESGKFSFEVDTRCNHRVCSEKKVRDNNLFGRPDVCFIEGFAGDL